MSNDDEWYYALQDESKGPFTRAEMSAFVRAGVVTGHTKVWHSSMSDWTVMHQSALRDLLGPGGVTPPPINPTKSEDVNRTRVSSGPAPGPGSEPVYTRPVAALRIENNSGLSQVLRMLIFVSAAFLAFQIARVLRANNQYATLLELENGAWLAISAILGMATLILFLVWKYRVTSNLVALKGTQSVTPAGAVFWYFVPVAWFWKPYEAMRNIVQGFDSAERHNLVGWWISFIAMWGVMILFVITIPGEVSTTQQANAYVGFSILLSAAEFLWCIFGAALIRDISTAETKAINGNMQVGQMA